MVFGFLRTSSWRLIQRGIVFKSLVARRNIGITRISNIMNAAPQKAPSWNFTPELILSEAKRIIHEANHLYDRLVAIDEADEQNFLKPFMTHEDSTGLLTNQLTFLQHVSADKALRDASHEATELLQNFEIETSLRRDLFLKFDQLWKTFNDRGIPSRSDKAAYENYKFVEKVHRDYIRTGLNLPEEKRELIKDIKKRLASNMLEFSKNLGEQRDFIAFTEEELKGVSDTVMEQFEKFEDDASGKIKYKVTFKYPDIFPVLKSAKNPETRKRAFIADQDKVPENEKLFKETLDLRSQLANLLGHSSYANYNLEIKMARNQEKVFEFINDLKNKLRPLGLKEVEILKQLKEKECKELELPYDGNYYIWDHRYYDNKYLQDNFNVNVEKISEYYPLESAISGMLDIYAHVMNLKFVEETGEERSVWHEDVKQLSVWNMDNPKEPSFVGWIYFDLHPREGKYGHAANFGLSAAYTGDNGRKFYPVTSLVCNFSKSTPSKPSLLKHNEITTFFHELGHGIHDLVGANGHSRFNGPGATPWDFVEAPSQMLEFWTWNKNELKALSRHYLTGEKIPDEMLDALVRSKHVNGALFALRQLHFGIFDMLIHTCKKPEELDLCQLWNETREEIGLVVNGSVHTRGYNSFGHLMSDSYSAGYYGYMWAEVFATDMYYTKFALDPLNVEAGKQYRDIVLARGGIYDVEENLTEFLGRKPNNNAFLKEIGL